MKNSEEASFKFHDYKNRLALSNRVGRLVWGIYAALFFKTMPTKYLNFIRIFGLRLFGAKLGRRGVSVHRTARIWAPWNLVMEDFTLIDQDCRIYNPGLVTLKRETVLSENVFLCTASHDIYSRGHELVVRPIAVNGRCWIAADALVLPGVTVGEGAVVAAGAVVSKDVGPWTVVAGNPAVPVKKRVFNKH